MAITAFPATVGLATYLKGSSPFVQPGLAPTGDSIERPAPWVPSQGRALSFHGGLIRGQPAITPTRTPIVTPTPKPPLIWPVDGWIAQGMWAKHPNGVDIAVNTGEPVRAVRDGRVIYAGGDPCCSYGFVIIVQHDNDWTSLYGHLSAFAVNVGDRVTQGQRLGLSGETGKAKGAHLHFELRASGAPVNPLDYLAPP